MPYSTKTALIVVDVQNDFLPPSGSLAVPNGQAILPSVLRLLDSKAYDWDLVVASQDFHPPDHISFATTHSKPAFSDLEVTDADGVTYIQTLWPAHCVQGTPGVEIEASVKPALERWGDKFEIVRKGWNRGLEAYSAFAGYPTSGDSPSTYTADAPPPASTPSFASHLRSKGIQRCVVVGLAEDYCVLATAQSSVEEGFETIVPLSATAAIDPKRGEECREKFEKTGGKTVEGGENWEEHLRRFLQ